MPEPEPAQGNPERTTPGRVAATAKNLDAAEPKRSWNARLQSQLAGRQVNLTLGIPGTGRVLNRPLRADAPGRLGNTGAEAEHPPGDGPDAQLAEAEQLRELADSLLSSLQAPDLSLWQRPEQSLGRRVATRLWPWLKPAPLTHFARFGAGVGKNAAPEAASPPPSPEAIRDAAQELAARVDARRQALEAAVEQSALAREQLRQLQQGTAVSRPTTDAGRTLAVEHSQRLAAARARLAQADHSTAQSSGQLRELLASTDLHRLAELSQAKDEQDERSTFTQQRLVELKAHGAALLASIASRGEAISLELNVKAEETRTLKALDLQLTAAERQAAQADSDLNDLHAQLGATASGSPAANALAPAIQHAEQQRAQAHQQHQALLQQLQQADREFAQLNEQIGTLYARLNQQMRAQHRAQRELGVLDTLGEQVRAAATQPAETNGLAGAERADKAALKQLRERFLLHQREVGNAFGAQTSTPLRAALKTLSDRLAGPTPASPMPAHLVQEIITSALADVTGQDSERAARLLAALNEQPVTHWINLAVTVRRPGATEASALQRDIIALNRKLAGLPRGTELLQLLSRDGEAPLDSAQGQALRVLWNADEAQQLESSHSVRGWLQQAKQVAAATLGEQALEFDDVDHGAYAAVRNGYLSNAPGSPYAQHDQRMKKATVEWVMRALAAKAPPPASAGPLPEAGLWRKAVPTLGKTPFGSRGLQRAYAVGESMGLDSPRRQVDQAVAERLQVLQQTLQACHDCPTANAERARAADAAQALVDHLAALQKGGAHLADVRLQAGDAKALRKRLGAQAMARHLAYRNQAAARGEKVGHNTLRKAPPVELPRLYTDMVEGRLCAYEALNRVEEQLRASLPAQHRPKVLDAPLSNDLAAAIKLLKTRHLSEKSDIVTFFKPFILDSRLRDRVRLGGGGSVGGGIPGLPYGLIAPIVSPIFSAEISRTDEAYAQLFMPVLGMELSFGKARTRAWEATGGVAAGPQLAPGVALQGAVTGRFAQQRTTTQSTLMRFFRTRHKDDEMRQNMLDALSSMVGWDVLEPERGRHYRGPLEAVFSRNPQVSVSQVEATTDTRALNARLAARLPSAALADGHNLSQTLGVEPGVYAEAERIKDQREEQGGHTRIVASKGDTAQQRAGVSAQLNVAPLSSGAIPLASTHGAQRQGLGLQLGASRDLAWSMEKHEISPFLLGDKQDGDLDRHAAKPRAMLNEIKQNRDLWLLRCIETLEPDENDQRNTADNRLRAATLLNDFEKNLRRLEKESHYCHYNVNYSMKGSAGAQIDGYRGIEALARQRGDAKTREHAQHAIDELLLMRSTWRPFMLIVRERARDSTTLGWRALARWQKVTNVEGQRTAAQFPPP
ncbi:type III effector [Pseudomonas typographi]|uniref:type III effector n=1 Tax=Pseudomonas typographi TaxID=2715964 RepID=UPI003B84644C